VLSVGAASAPDVLGPYTDVGGPLVEHPQGVIDTNYFQDDDGSRWFLYKIDGNSVGQPTPIYLRRLADDGLSFAPGSEPVELLRNAPATWEGGVIEAPWLVKRDGVYYLFYSGNVYDHRYRTGVARASSLAGPYEKKGAPILANNERWVGPGHGSVVTVGGMDYFVYHAWTNAGNGTQAGATGRQVLVDRIAWQDGWPSIHDGTPSRTPQPWPGTE
jgi:arabinan endo-1,5-alpha-L-arabinosidase